MQKSRHKVKDSLDTSDFELSENEIEGKADDPSISPEMRASRPTILPRISGPSNTNSTSYAYAYESLNGASNSGLWRTIYVWRRFLVGGILLLLLAWLAFSGTGSIKFGGELLHLIMYAGNCPVAG